MKKFVINTIILFCLTIGLIYYLFRDRFFDIINILSSANFWYILLVFVVFAISFVLEALVLKIIINKYDKKYSLGKVLKLNIFTKFFNGITPFSTGGQPLQVYELKKDGISPINGTAIIVENFIVFQTVVVVMGIISLILNSIFHIVHVDSVVYLVSIVGYVVNFILLILLFLICINKNVNKKIVRFIINILSKIKIVKNKDKQIEKWDGFCNDYYEGYRRLIKDKKNVILCLVIEFIAMIILFSMPLFVIYSLNYKFDYNIVYILVLSVYIYFGGSYIPIPGGTGGVEYAFLGFYTYYIESSYLFSCLIIWRFFYYYFPVLVGAIGYNVDRIIRARKKV